MITRPDIVAHLERGARMGFLNGQKQYTPLRSAFVEETPSDGAFEFHADMGAVPWPANVAGQAPGTGTDGRTGVPAVGGLGGDRAITILGGNERGLQVFNRDWDIPIGIQHNAINDERAGSLDSWARRAGIRFEQHKDYLCFDALEKGESATYGNAYNKLTFFNNSHVDPGAEYTTTQDNRFAKVLSNDNFKTVYVAAHKFLDDRGQPSGHILDLLIHPVDLIDEAGQISDNPLKSVTGDNDKNPFAGIVKRLQAPGAWLNATAWFLVSSQAGFKPLGLQVRQAPQLVTWDDHSQGGGIRYYKWLSRYEVFYRDWRTAAMGNT